MKKVTKFGLEVLTGKPLSFLLEFIDKTGAKFFCIQMQINSFGRNLPARAKQMPSKVLFVSKKRQDCSRSVTARQNFDSWQQ